MDKNGTQPKSKSPRVFRAIPSLQTKNSDTKPASKDFSLSHSNRDHKLSAWQNPIVTYFNRHYPRFRFKREKPSKQKRLINRIMVMLAFFSISIGLWDNFRQLWLQNNGFSAEDVSNIISISTFVGAIGIIVMGKYVKISRLKPFMTMILIFRCINLFILALLNGTGLKILIDIFTLTEIVTGSLFLITIYPLITTLMKSNNIYSRRKLVEYLFCDVGILIGGIFIGQHLGDFVFSYNVCLLLSLFFLIVSAIIMYRLKIKITERHPDNEFSAVKYIFNSKIQRVYMVYVILVEISFGIVAGLKMLMLTDMFGFSAGIATNYLLIVGLCADVLGILALRFFTPKNDYATITIKYGIRFVFFSLAGLSGSNFLCFLAFTWMILSSTAYDHITDGYYVNAVDNRYQFRYNTVRNVIQKISTAIGTFICGRVFGFGAAAIFGLGAFVLIPQLITAYYLIYLRQHKKDKIATLFKAR